MNITTSPALRVLRAARARLRRQGYRVYRRGDTLYWQHGRTALWLAAPDDNYIVGGLQTRIAPTRTRVSTHFTWALAEYQQRRIPAALAPTMITNLTEIWRTDYYAHPDPQLPAGYHCRRPAQLRRAAAGLGLRAAAPRRARRAGVTVCRWVGSAHRR